MKHGWLERMPLEPRDRQRVRLLENVADATMYVLRENLSTPEALLQALSLEFRCPMVTLHRYHPDETAVALLGEEDARRLKALPLFRLGDLLYVALCDPQDMDVRDYVRKATGMEVEPVVALAPEIEVALNRIYLTTQRSGQAIEQLVKKIGLDRERGDARDLVYGLEDREAPTIKLVDRILAQAIHLRASDIHLEPYADRSCLRYRIDGRLHEYPAPPLSLLSGVVSRIKIASNLDIAEKRLPQDGRISIVVDHRGYDLRVSIIPYLHGEGAVIRVLNPGEVSMELTTLGFDLDILERYQRLIERPYGIILVTGPTGSGKTTTLYATLRRIYRPDRKFLTLEDPVENQIVGINQIQMHSDIGLTFGAGLRAVLRHDPDVIMLGEIRDLESAEIAVRASLTGHLLFSTLHTNNASQALVRLVDMGMPAYQVMASLAGVLAQRLMRRLCPKCKVSALLEKRQIKALNLGPGVDRVFEPRGCPDCNYLGYRGRVAVYELLEMTPGLRRLSAQRSWDDDRIRAIAKKEGFRTMREGAIGKLAEGVTSLDEVMSTTLRDLETEPD